MFCVWNLVHPPETETLHPQAKGKQGFGGGLVGGDALFDDREAPPPAFGLSLQISDFRVQGLGLRVHGLGIGV